MLSPPVPGAEALPSVSVPELIVVPPLNVLALLRVNVPPLKAKATFRVEPSASVPAKVVVVD